MYTLTGELHVGCKTSACIVRPTHLCRRSFSRCQSDVLTYIGNNSLCLQTVVAVAMHCIQMFYTVWNLLLQSITIAN